MMRMRLVQIPVSLLLVSMFMQGCKQSDDNGSSTKYLLANGYSGLWRGAADGQIVACMSGDSSEERKQQVNNAILSWVAGLQTAVNDSLAKTVSFTSGGACDVEVVFKGLGGSPAYTSMGNPPVVNMDTSSQTWFGSLPVMVHEFGHAFGLSDTYDLSQRQSGVCVAGQTRNAVMCDPNMGQPQEDDIKGVIEVYKGFNPSAQVKAGWVFSGKAGLPSFPMSGLSETPATTPVAGTTPTTGTTTPTETTPTTTPATTEDPDLMSIVNQINTETQPQTTTPDATETPPSTTDSDDTTDNCDALKLVRLYDIKSKEKEGEVEGQRIIVPVNATTDVVSICIGGKLDCNSNPHGSAKRLAVIEKFVDADRYFVSERFKVDAVKENAPVLIYGYHDGQLLRCQARAKRKP